MLLYNFFSLFDNFFVINSNLYLIIDFITPIFFFENFLLQFFIIYVLYLLAVNNNILSPTSAGIPLSQAAAVVSEFLDWERKISLGISSRHRHFFPIHFFVANRHSLVFHSCSPVGQNLHGNADYVLLKLYVHKIYNTSIDLFLLI